MNEREIELARKRYNSLLEERNALETKKSRILELENNPLVKEYLGLKEEVKNNKQKLSDDSIVISAFSGIAAHTKDSNKLLINIGEGNSNVFYIDLETDEMYSVKLFEKKEFEKNNKIIYLNNKNDNWYLLNLNANLNKINRLRIKFFESVLEKTQDEAVDEILNKNNKNVKRKIKK